MNLAFQALVILAFLTPGFAFRIAYNAGAWAYPLGRLGPFAEQLPKVLAHAAWLNVAVACLATAANRVFPDLVPPIDYQSVIYWLSNNFGAGQVHLDEAVRSVVRYPVHIFAYFATVYTLAWIAGACMHGFVRKLKWDRKKRWLRFENDWHYLFMGDVLDFSEASYRNSPGERRTAAGATDRKATVVAAVVDLKDQSYLYQGFLIDFFFDANGNLDRILLDGVKRRTLQGDRDRLDRATPSYYDDDGFYIVRGHYFVLRMSEIKTLNVDYITTDDLTTLEDLAEDRLRQAEEERGYPGDRGLGG